MAHSAKLISIDAVRDMAIALTIFGDEVMAALDELDINVRRSLDWIEHDRKKFWTHEVRQSLERFGEARAELEKALTYRKMADQTPSCRQERAILAKAKHRVQTAEEKSRVIPHWEHAIKHSVQDVNGMQTQLANWLRSELPKALNALEQMTTTLEHYAAVQGGVQASASQKVSVPQRAETDTVEAESDEDHVAKAKETKEPNHENLGSTHASGQTPPSDEGPGTGQN